MNRLTALSGDFLFIFVRNLEEIAGYWAKFIILSAKGVRISLGDRFRVSGKSPGCHVVLDLVQ